MRKILLVVGLSLALVIPAFAVAGTASAATSKAAYSWHVADALVEGGGSPPWAIAEAPSGDTILLDGTGLLDVAAKTASGAGRFIHLAPDASLAGRGTFTAHRLISFQFYGCVGEGPFFCGGLAKLEVTLTPKGTSLELPATLWIDCLIGDKIPSGGAPARAEGIRLNVKGLHNFNKTEESGETVFITQ